MPEPKATKGHWPAGSCRHPDGGNWSRIRLSLTSLTTEHYERGIRSTEAVAAALDVSGRSVRRWISGEDVPAPELQDLLRTWCAEQVKNIKAARSKEKKLKEQS